MLDHSLDASVHTNVSGTSICTRCLLVKGQKVFVEGCVAFKPKYLVYTGMTITFRIL